MLWVTFILLLALMSLIILWPIYASEEKINKKFILILVPSLVITLYIYSIIGNPDIETITQDNTANDMVEALAERLEKFPGDIQEWRMLGRSSIVTENYQQAADAYRRVLEIQEFPESGSFSDLAESLLFLNNGNFSEEIVSLFDNALHIYPDNPKALFYGGLIASSFNDQELAVSRWQRLLNSSPPEDITNILLSKIAEWRGNETIVSFTDEDIKIPLKVSLKKNINIMFKHDTNLFIIARDPDNPRPPIAVIRRKTSELPLDIILSNDNVMIPGTTLTNFNQLEIIARTSDGNNPVAESGDWYGSIIISSENFLKGFNIVIEQQIP